MVCSFLLLLGPLRTGKNGSRAMGSLIVERRGASTPTIDHEWLACKFAVAPKFFLPHDFAMDLKTRSAIEMAAVLYGDIEDMPPDDRITVAMCLLRLCIINSHRDRTVVRDEMADHLRNLPLAE